MASKLRSVVPVLLLLVALALVIILPFVIKPKSNQSTIMTNSPGGASGSNDSNPTPSSPGGSMPSPVSSDAITGRDGSTIHAADGTTFIYHNAFGGICKCFADLIFFAQLETVEGFGPSWSTV
jgi:hypothetical protein